VSNPLSFTFKNEDQKAQDITAKTYEFNLIDSETKQSVVTRNLTILDDGSTITKKGTASITVTEGDLLTLDAKFYNYAIREVDADDSTIRTVTFADSFYNAAGTVEILDGAYPDMIDSIAINSFTSTTGPLTYTSSAYEANPGANNNVALHTIAIYQKSFVGTLRIQGTMVSTPGDADYFDIATISFVSNSDPVTYYNFNGVYENVRFSWGNTSGNTGRVDKILYRH
jgi:phage tail protein X